MSHPSRFTIVSYNICGVNNAIRRSELQQYASTSCPSVIVLQEPKLSRPPAGSAGRSRSSDPPRLTNYIVCSFNHATEPTGVLFYIHKSCTFRPYDHIPHCTPYRSHVAGTRTVAGFVWVSSPLLSCPIVVGGVYIHNTCIKSDFQALARSVELASQPLSSSPPSSPPLPVFLVGDFNARHPSWDGQYRDATYTSQQGKWLHETLIAPHAQPRLTLLNTHFPSSCMIPTHTDRRTDSVIDLALSAHAHMLSGMDVLTGAVIGSDHFPLLLSFHVPACCPPRSPSPHVPRAVVVDEDDVDMERKYDEVPSPSPDAPPPDQSRVKWKTDCDWSLYEKHVTESLTEWTVQYSDWRGDGMPAQLTQADINTCWQGLLDVMLSSARACVGSVHVDSRCQEWWSPQLSSLHNTYRSSRRRLR
jgi:endonuclease/exonuclease/phosphatase family metal-dependent hydrolase